MRAARSLVLVALLPLFAACQLLDGPRESASHVGQTRMQGQLTAADGKLLFQPCNEQRSYVVNDIGGTSVLQEAATLADAQGKLFADVRGSIVASGADSRLDLAQLYRVERSGTACNDPNFKLLILRAAAIELPRGLRVNSISPNVLVEAMGKYAPYFRGFKPVPAADVALAYAKSVEGLQTGQTFHVG